jgi:TRAP-type mannitol/chloroaromatic compound transport system permease large subunit
MARDPRTPRRRHSSSSLVIGVPIAFAIGIASVVGTFADDAGSGQRHRRPADADFAVNTFPLLAVIFFVFAGVHHGARRRGHGAWSRWPRCWSAGCRAAWRRSWCVASMFFGGVTGSAVAEVSSIGSMMIPAMVKDGYSRRFATAIVLTAATMGPIIPPSIGMIVFAHIAGNVSIAALFVAGIIPGRADRRHADGGVADPRQALSPEDDAGQAGAPREDPSASSTAWPACSRW